MWTQDVTTPLSKIEKQVDVVKDMEQEEVKDAVESEQKPSKEESKGKEIISAEVSFLQESQLFYLDEELPPEALQAAQLFYSDEDELLPDVLPAVEKSATKLLPEVLPAVMKLPPEMPPAAELPMLSLSPKDGHMICGKGVKLVDGFSGGVPNGMWASQIIDISTSEDEDGVTDDDDVIEAKVYVSFPRIVP